MQGFMSRVAHVLTAFPHLLLPNTVLIPGHDELKKNKSRKGGNDGTALLHFDCKFYKSIYKAGMVPHLFGKVILNINEG